MLNFLPVADYLAQPRPVFPWVIKDLLPVSGSMLIYAPPKTGKTWLTLGIAHAVATNQLEWNGFAVQQTGWVAYLQIDTPDSLFKSAYLDKITLVRGVSLGKLAIADRLIAPYPFNILSEGGVWLRKALDAIAQQVGEYPVMVIVDTFREMYPSEENESHVQKNVLAALRFACNPAALVIVAHGRKLGQDSIVNLMNDNRGSSYLVGAVDSVMCMVSDEDARTAIITYKSRTVNQQSKSLMECPVSGLWISDVETAALDFVVNNRLSPKESLRSMARRLLDRLGGENTGKKLSLETCRRRITAAVDDATD